MSRAAMIGGVGRVHNTLGWGSEGVGLREMREVFYQFKKEIKPCNTES
jgi:hypothetical protein